MSRCDVPRLLSWASDNGVRLHPSVEVRTTADRGLGVFATGPLAAGVPILSVPSGLLLSPLRAAPSQTPPSLAAVRERIARLLTRVVVGRREGDRDGALLEVAEALGLAAAPPGARQRASRAEAADALARRLVECSSQ